MKLPLWSIPLAILAVVVGLQVFPQTGVFLMLFGAPGWATPLVNAALVLMVVDVWRGRARRWLLLVPAVVYGGNLAASAVGYVEYLQLDRELVAANRANATPFDPLSQSLVVPEGGAAQRLVSDYRLAVAFVSNRNFAPFDHLAYRLVPKERCVEVTNDARRGIYHFGVIIDHVLVGNACALQAPEDPSHPTIVLDRERTDQSGFLLATTRWTTRISTPGRPTGQIVTGSATIPSPIPQPIIGCTLIDSTSEWKCFWGLARMRLPLATPNGDGEYGAVADALGLQPRAVVRNGRTRSIAAEEFTATGDGTATVERIKAGVYSDTEHAFAVLDRLIADPTQPTGELEEELLANETVLVTYADKMVDGLARALAAGSKGRDARRVLGDTIAALPDQTFASIGPRLLDLMRGQTMIETAVLYIRLGELGDAAVPILMEQLNAKLGAHVPAALGICRVGAPAGSVARDALRKLLAIDIDSVSPTGDLRPAATLALLRLGFRDDVAADVAFHRSGKGWVNFVGRKTTPSESWYDEKLATVSPSSPSSVCTPPDTWPNTPAAHRLFG